MVDKEKKLAVSGDGVFFTLQGEGDSIGRPAVFLRLQACNLKCKFSTSECDSSYTWKTTPEALAEMKLMVVSEVAKEIEKYPCDRLVVTGGEPMLQQVALVDLFEMISLTHPFIEIETNGTIMPIPEFFKFSPIFNCSPKLSNSGNDLSISVVPKVLNRLSWEDTASFKFVVSKDDDFKEIAELVAQCHLPSHRVIIMPEGVSVEDLSERMKKFAELCKKHGWRMTPRLQFYIWGNTRRT